MSPWLYALICVGMMFTTLGQVVSMRQGRAALGLCLAGIACCLVAFIWAWSGVLA